MVGAAVPCRPPRQPDRDAVSLKTCSPVFVSDTCGAQGETLVEPFVAPRSFFYILYILYTVKLPHAGQLGQPGQPGRVGRTRYPPLYILYTVNKLRWATKASLTFRRLLRTPRPQPNGRGGSPCRPPRPYHWTPHGPPPFYISYTVRISPSSPRSPDLHGQTRAGGRGLPPLPLEGAHGHPLSLHFLHFLHG